VKKWGVTLKTTDSRENPKKKKQEVWEQKNKQLNNIGERRTGFLMGRSLQNVHNWLCSKVRTPATPWEMLSSYHEERKKRKHGMFSHGEANQQMRTTEVEAKETNTYRALRKTNKEEDQCARTPSLEDPPLRKNKAFKQFVLLHFSITKKNLIPNVQRGKPNK